MSGKTVHKKHPNNGSGGKVIALARPPAAAAAAPTVDPLVAAARTKMIRGVCAPGYRGQTYDWDAGSAANTAGIRAAYIVCHLSEALAEAPEHDAHLVTYVLYHDDEQLEKQPRANKSGLLWLIDQGYALRVELLVADVDNPGHADWTDELHARFNRQLAELEVLSSCGIYLTRHGYRLLQPLIEPVTVPDVERYTSAWLDELQAAGIVPDTKCDDWTRHYRFPHFCDANGAYTSPLVDVSRMAPRAIVPRPAERRVSSASATTTTTTKTSYGAAALHAECARIAAMAPDTGRNEQLNRSAFALGQLVGGGMIDEDQVCEALHAAALECGLDEAEINPTIRSGLDAGKAEPRCVITVDHAIHRAVDAAIKALARDETIYCRGGKLVRVVRDAEPDDAEGSPRIEPCRTATLRERLTHAATWSRATKKGYHPCIPTDAIVQAVACRGEWADIRPLVAVTETPIMRLDGTLVQTAGYDRTTGYLYEPSGDYPIVPDEPTREIAVTAREVLMEVWADFPFVDEAARHVPLAALLTLLARPAVRGPVPGIALDANAPATGKGLVADTVTMIAMGRAAPKMAYTDDDVEMTKVLGAYALRGTPLIVLDNATAPIRGDSLARVLTAEDRVEQRVLGHSEIANMPWRALLIATGNNLAVEGDLIRRFLVARMMTELERPELRDDFAHPDLLAWVRDERPRLVAAGLALLRAYVVSGRPNVGVAKLGSYERWSETVASAIRWAGGPDVTVCLARDAQDEPEEHAAMRIVLRDWHLLGAGGVTLREAVRDLYPYGRMEMGVDDGDGRNDLREALHTLARGRDERDAPTPTKLGKVFRRWRKRWIAQRCLDVAAAQRHDNVKQWCVREYTV